MFDPTNYITCSNVSDFMKVTRMNNNLHVEEPAVPGASSLQNKKVNCNEATSPLDFITFSLFHFFNQTSELLPVVFYITCYTVF